MSDTSDMEQKIREVLWESLDGGNYDLEALKVQVKTESHFAEDLSFDSLDMVDFYLRLEDVVGKTIPQEAYPDLVSIKALIEFLEK